MSLRFRFSLLHSYRMQHHRCSAVRFPVAESSDYIFAGGRKERRKSAWRKARSLPASGPTEGASERSRTSALSPYKRNCLARYHALLRRAGGERPVKTPFGTLHCSDWTCERARAGERPSASVRQTELGTAARKDGRNVEPIVRSSVRGLHITRTAGPPK